MKKILLFCIIFLALLSSCTTTEALSYENRTEEENIKAKDALINAEREALASIESTIFKDSFNIKPNSSLVLYSEEIPMFSSTLSDYYKTIQNVVLQVLPSLVDTTYSLINNLEFSFPYYFVQKNDSSVSEELSNKFKNDLYTLVFNGVNEYSTTLSSSYSIVEREALIWKKNQENLKSVGMGKDLMDPVKITNEEIASFVVDEFLSSLSLAEVTVRTRPLTAASYEAYSVFWEYLSYE